MRNVILNENYLIIFNLFDNINPSFKMQKIDEKEEYLLND